VLSMNSGRQLWRGLLPIATVGVPLALTTTQGFACSTSVSPTASCIGFSLATGRHTGTYDMPWTGQPITLLAVGGGYLFTGVFGASTIEATPLGGGRAVALPLPNPSDFTDGVEAFALGDHHGVLVLGAKDIAVW
jgi:hypothetical protein